MENKKFIITTSSKTAEILKKCKLKLINVNESTWCFINEPTRIQFDNLEKVVFTDKLFI